MWPPRVECPLPPCPGVLNRTGRYSLETSRKVLEVARELGYTPNYMAKSLKRKRTEQIALAVADIGNPVYVAMAKAVQQVAKEQGYRLVLLSTEALASEEFGIIRSLSKQYVDGLIISPLLYSDKHRELIKQAKRPVVVITGTESDPDIDSVLVDPPKECAWPWNTSWPKVAPGSPFSTVARIQCPAWPV